MRLLFSCNPAIGHVTPALPLARAARERGHEVAFLSGPDVRAALEGDGFELLSCGPDFGSLVGEAFERFPDTPMATPQDQQRFGFGRLFSVVRVGATIDEAASIARAFQPDVVINEVGDFVGPLVAAQLDRPNATVGVSLVPTDELLQLAADGVASYWQNAGLTPRADAGIYRAMYLNQWPRSVQRPLPDGQCEVLDLRPDVYGAGSSLPSDLEHVGVDRPLVYVTFGTMFGDVPTFRTVVEGLLELDVDIVVTVGNSLDPAALELDGSNLVVREFIPQGALLGRCALVVNHGGSGSVLGPLHYGVPLLVVPLGADQLENAEQLAAAEVARVIQPAGLTSPMVESVARAAMNDDELRRNAMAVRDEIATMATPFELMASIEALAR